MYRTDPKQPLCVGWTMVECRTGHLALCFLLYRDEVGSSTCEILNRTWDHLHANHDASPGHARRVAQRCADEELI